MIQIIDKLDLHFLSWLKQLMKIILVGNNIIERKLDMNEKTYNDIRIYWIAIVDKGN